MCVSSNADVLSLEVGITAEDTYYPNLIKTELTLELINLNFLSTFSTHDSTEGSGSSILCVVWNASAVAESTEMVEWTMFPSAGLLLPGRK